MSHWLHPEAEAELGDAAVYYAENASPSIAQAFLGEYVRVRDRVIQNQQLGTPASAQLRVIHFSRFPYSLIYSADATLGPQIFAIAHQRRAPAYWATRLA